MTMYIYDKEASLANEGYASLSRNTVTGSSVLSLERSEGEQGDKIWFFRYENPDVTFEFATHTDSGDRQVKAILPNPVYDQDLTDEGWRALSKKRDALERELNINHFEIVRVEHPMPLDLELAADLMRLFWMAASHGGEYTHCNYAVGFANKDPKAPRGQATPYLKMDQDGVFSIGVNGKW